MPSTVVKEVWAGGKKGRSPKENSIAMCVVLRQQPGWLWMFTGKLSMVGWGGSTAVLAVANSLLLSRVMRDTSDVMPPKSSSIVQLLVQGCQWNYSSNLREILKVVDKWSIIWTQRQPCLFSSNASSSVLLLFTFWMSRVKSRNTEDARVDFNQWGDQKFLVRGEYFCTNPKNGVFLAQLNKKLAKSAIHCFASFSMA